MSSARETAVRMSAVHIARFVGLVDPRAGGIGDLAVALDERVEMVLDLIDVGRIGRQRRRLGDRLRRAQRRAAELHDALGHGVDMAVELGSELVDHFVNGDELRSA